MTQARTHGLLARWIALPLAGTGLVVLAACGSGTAAAAGSTGGSAAGSTTGGAASADAFTSCLAENGVTMPQRPDGAQSGGPGGQDGVAPSGAPEPGATPPGGGGGQAGSGKGTDAAPPGVDATTWAAAQQACASLAPTPPGGTGAAAG